MAESVKVLVRCRPMNKREEDLKCEVAVFMDSSIMQVSIINPSDQNSPPKTFTFDAVYHMDSITENIYKDMAYPLVEGVLEGYNGTIFAYGQTGCGKSFTMQGVKSPSTQLGLIPRAFEHIFDVISTAEETKYLVHSSFLEIYNEEIRDLLGSDAKRKLELKEHPEKGVYITELSKNPCHDPTDCEKLMERGWNNRSVGETLMNKDSSRSHSIFTIFIEMITPAKNGRDQIRAGKLNLVDLAGSERQAKTGATGDRLKEATKINLSLSALGNVISSLVDGKSKHIPYRDSKLTRLLQDSLGGNTKTMMVACLSPADNNYDETLSTLRYANRAKQIKNKPKINEDPKDALLREYQDEIRKLREQLDTAGGPERVLVGKTVEAAAVARERDRLRAEFDEEMSRLLHELERQKTAAAKIGFSKVDLENETAKIRREFEEREKTMKEEFEHQKTVLAGGELPENLKPDVYDKLLSLQKQMVGGELAHNQQALQKRRQAHEDVQKRRREIAAAHSKNAAEGAGEDEVLVMAYEDIQSTLKARTELAKKMKVRLKAQQQDIRDIEREFAVERDDYLETIRRQEQQVKLLQQMLERVQPTVRRDCNYADLEAVRRQAVWDEVDQRWRLPDVHVVKTKLPPAAVNNFLSSSSNGSSPSNQKPSECQPARNPNSQTAPARLGVPWDSVDEEDKFLKRLEKSAEENIAGQYFKPTGNRQAEILSKSMRSSDSRNNTASTSFCAAIGPGLSVSHNSLHAVSINDSVWTRDSRASPRPMAASWGSPSTVSHVAPRLDEYSPCSSSSNSPSGSHNVLENSLSFWSASKHWLGMSSTFSPESSTRKPTRLAPVQDKKKNLNTMDLI